MEKGLSIGAAHVRQPRRARQSPSCFGDTLRVRQPIALPRNAKRGRPNTKCTTSFAKLYAEDTTFTYSLGQVVGNPDRVKGFTYPFSELKGNIQKVRIYGDFAIVNDRSDYTAHNSTPPAPFRLGASGESRQVPARSAVFNQDPFGSADRSGVQQWERQVAGDCVSIHADDHGDKNALMRLSRRNLPRRFAAAHAADLQNHIIQETHMQAVDNQVRHHGPTLRTCRAESTQISSGQRKRRTTIVGILVTFLFSWPSLAQAQPGPYTLYPINTNTGAVYSPAMDVNDDGVVVGYWNGPTTDDPTLFSRGYVWTRASGLQPMITDSNTMRQFPISSAINDPSQTLRINSNGVIAGTGCFQIPSFNCQAATWSSSQGLRFLGAFDNNAHESHAAGINDTPQVVGYSWGGGYNQLGPFIWSVDGIQSLSGFPGYNGRAFGVNAAGTTVGVMATVSDINPLAFVWSASNGTMVIPDLPSSGSVALAINDFGTVVGYYLLPDLLQGGSTYHVFRWSAASGTRDLNAPAGSVDSMDINNAGDIVVTIILPSSGTRVPYLYRNGAWTDLNTLLPPDAGFTLQYATAINNKGWITGIGSTSSPFITQQGYVMVPPNRAPVASDGSVQTNEDTAVTGTLSASDADGDPLTFSVVTNGVNGSVVITNPATGAFTYTPNANANGIDTFQLKVNDGALDSNIATITISIVPINDAPVASNGTATVTAGGSVSGSFLASDIDSSNLTYSIVTNASKGTAAVTNAATGSFTYIANQNSSGTDSFTFMANDGGLDSNVATVTVTISPACAANISASVSITQGMPKLDRKTGRYTQSVTLKNNDGTVAGPLSLVLDGLSANATLFNATGTTGCVAPTGTPYINVGVGTDGFFGTREKVSVTLEFQNPSGQTISYTPRVLVGTGPR
jgi:hypothetical protein